MIILASKHIRKKQQVHPLHLFFSPNISGFISALQDFILLFCSYGLDDVKSELT